MLENFNICLNAVLPLFLMMAVGYAVKRAGLIRDSDIPRFNNIAFRTFLPCLLFYSIYTSDLSDSVRPELILFAVGGIFIIYFAVLFFVLAIEKAPEKRGVMIQGLYRTNYVVIGLPIAESLAGNDQLGPVALLIAIIVPIFNVLAVITLEVFRGGRLRVGTILLSILKNPMIIGTALGLFAQAFHVVLPDVLFTAVEDMGMAATPLQLLLLGAFFNFSEMSRYRRPLTIVVLGRLIVLPGIALTIAAAAGFRGIEFVALLGCFASSTAISSFTMAQQMGGDAELAGDIVVLTSALCPLSILIWSFLFKSLGLY